MALEEAELDDLRAGDLIGILLGSVSLSFDDVEIEALIVDSGLFSLALAREDVLRRVEEIWVILARQIAGVSVRVEEMKS